MISLLFIFLNFLAICTYDAWKMTKSELIYWGYGGKEINAYDADASEAASISQYSLWYFYVIFTAIGYFGLLGGLINLLCILFLHWCGLEDFGYFTMTRWIKNPPKYIATHKFIRIFGIDFPEKAYWLGTPRKVWFFTIPSLMGFVCGTEVPAKKFVALVLSAVAFIILLSFII